MSPSNETIRSRIVFLSALNRLVGMRLRSNENKIRDAYRTRALQPIFGDSL